LELLQVPRNETRYRARRKRKSFMVYLGWVGGGTLKAGSISVVAGKSAVEKALHIFPEVEHHCVPTSFDVLELKARGFTPHSTSHDFVSLAYFENLVGFLALKFVAILSKVDCCHTGRGAG
jgi:hypothetical protein